ncbi:kinase [Thraustotheca clavata]|uniref:Kinase n=1 Tax=Thraustotheca clavata TaxID=74557 RepID=A0A1W0A3P1_9STRA|nr:kinase [Thraustotheca clavata]
MSEALNKPMQYIDTGDFEIDKSDILGSGTFGNVYMGKYNNELVTVKSFTRQTQDPEREINTMLQCRSPYVLHLIGICGMNTSELKLVLQYMDGGDLCSHLDKKQNKKPSLTNYSELEIAWVVANGLADILHKRCIHRDVKSPNILLSTKHYIILVDMRLTRDLRTTMTQGAGTPYYTAPEVLKNSGHYSVQADIYSFGVLLTELDTLLLPYSNVTISPVDFMNGVCSGTLRSESSIDCAPWFKNLIDRCLAHDPNERQLHPKSFESDNHCTSEDNGSKGSLLICGEFKHIFVNDNCIYLVVPIEFTGLFFARYTSLPVVDIDINCPSCQEPNSILYADCMKCYKTLLQNSIKVNILIRRLQNVYAKPSYFCPMCHLENDNITTNQCDYCNHELCESEKLLQFIAQITMSQPS